ncbi:MAG: eL32 family ribosomal protein [Candidatus Pacearchaeota archaeon]
MVADALKGREEKKKRKPTYVRSDWHKRSRIGRGRKKLQVWRRPKGRHNKIRERRRGKPARPEVGYGSPSSVKGFIGDLKPVYVSSLDELSGLTNQNIAIINGRLGMKKKAEIFKKAKELGIKTNLPENFLEQVENFLKEKKQKREEFEKTKREKEKRKEERIKEEERRAKEEKEKREREEKEKEIKKEEEERKKIEIEAKEMPVTTKGLEKKGVGYHRQALEK